MTNTLHRKGFPFLFALCLAASIIIWFGVDVERGRRDAARWAQEMREGNGASVSTGCDDYSQEAPRSLAKDSKFAHSRAVSNGDEPRA
jgi:hypothetical protein